MNVNVHLSEDALELYSLDRLPDEELMQFKSHILQCSTCQERLADFESFGRTMRAALEKCANEPERPARVPMLTWARPALALAAGLVIVLLGLPVLRRAETPQIIELSTFRSGSTTQSAAGKPLELRLRAPAGSPVRVTAEIVTASGQQSWSGPAVLTDGQWILKPGSLSSGIYWVRVYASDSTQGDPLHEYPLVAR